MAGALKKKLGLDIQSSKESDGARTYRIASQEAPTSDLEELRHRRVRAGAAPSCPFLLRLRGSQSGSPGSDQGRLQSFIFQRQVHGPWSSREIFQYLFISI